MTISITGLTITSSEIIINYDKGGSSIIEWDGWTTTTNDPGDLDNRYCYGKSYPLPSEIKNNPTKWGKTTGTAAIPWSWICKIFKNKTEYCNNYIKGTSENMGPSKDGKCLLFQIINKYPNELKDINDPYFKNSYDFSNNNPKAVSINSNNIRAKYKNKAGIYTNIPTYKIFLINGCGGFCKGAKSDCFNSCSDGYTLTDCNFNSCSNCIGCKSNNILQNNDWVLKSQSNYDEYLKYSYPIEVSNFSDKEFTNYGKQFTGDLSTNTCSGNGLNLDIIGPDSYLWEDYIIDSDIVSLVSKGYLASRCDKNITSCNKNFVFGRYKWVPCDTDQTQYDS